MANHHKLLIDYIPEHLRGDVHKIDCTPYIRAGLEDAHKARRKVVLPSGAIKISEPLKLNIR